jgi:hypothetical protein
MVIPFNIFNIYQTRSLFSIFRNLYLIFHEKIYVEKIRNLEMEKKKKNREYTPMIKCKFDGNFQVLLKEDE